MMVVESTAKKKGGNPLRKKKEKKKEDDGSVIDIRLWNRKEEEFEANRRPNPLGDPPDSYG